MGDLVCFLICTILMALLILLGQAGPWFEDGYVEVGPPGQTLDLTGTPGDQINVRLRLPEGADPDEREMSVSLRDEESDFTTALPLELETDDGDEDGEPDEFYVRLVVPGVPEHPRANLAGVLGGSYAVAGAGREEFQVPLTLQVVSKGEAVTSGYKDMHWQHAVEWAGVTLVFAVAFALTIALVAWGVVTARRNARS